MTLSNQPSYKDKEDESIRKRSFEVHKDVMVHLRKEMFPAKTYNTVKYKIISPYKIIRNPYVNAYEVQLIEDMNISNIFDVADL